MATFVLIPGAGGHAAYWNSLIPELETRGHRAIAIDIKENDPSLDCHHCDRMPAGLRDGQRRALFNGGCVGEANRSERIRRQSWRTTIDGLQCWKGPVYQASFECHPDVTEERRREVQYELGVTPARRPPARFGSPTQWPPESFQ